MLLIHLSPHMLCLFNWVSSVEYMSVPQFTEHMRICVIFFQYTERESDASFSIVKVSESLRYRLQNLGYKVMSNY